MWMSYCVLFWMIFGSADLASTHPQMTIFRGSIGTGVSCIYHSNTNKTKDLFTNCIISCAQDEKCHLCYIPTFLKDMCAHCNINVEEFSPFYNTSGPVNAVKSYSNITKSWNTCPDMFTTTKSATTQKLTTTKKMTTTPKKTSTTRKPTTRTTTKKTTKRADTTLKTTTRQMQCPSGWFDSRRSKGLWCMRMEIYPSSPMYRTDAIRVCKSIGAIISGIEYYSEMEFVRNRTRASLLINTFPDSKGYQGWGVWVTGERLNGEKEFTLSDPYLTRQRPNLWYRGQPDGFRAVPQQNCLQMMVPRDAKDDRSGKWDDVDCNNIQAYGMLMKAVVCGKVAV